MIRLYRLLFLTIPIVWLHLGCACSAQSSAVQLQQAVVKLNSVTESTSNLLKLSDLASIRGPEKLSSELGAIPIAPSPQLGQTAIWTREQIQSVLEKRGMNPASIRWEGNSQTKVIRQSLDKKERSDDPVVDLSQSSILDSGKFIATPSMPTTIDKSKFTSSFTTPAIVGQAERVVQVAIDNYLKTKTDSEVSFRVTPTIPPEVASLLVQRKQILGVAGGVPPFEGKQTFELLVRGSYGESAIPIEADIQLPELILAAVKPLSRGHILKSSDLVLISTPRGFKESPDTCFLQPEDLVGKELKRSMSTQQVIRRPDIGSPTLIHAGDAVKIEVIVGGLVIETAGRAIESGGKDDLIHVESAEHRKRLLARVREERIVEVSSLGNSSMAVPPSKTGNKNNPVPSKVTR